MANNINLINKNKIIDTKVEIIINNIMNDYYNNRINNSIELLYRIKKDLNNLYASVDKPIYKFIELSDTLIAEDFNSMIKDSVKDFKVLLEDNKNLIKQISDISTDLELNKKMISDSINYAEKRVEIILSRVSSFQNNKIIFSDTFEKNMNTYTNNKDKAFYNHIDGVLTLPQTNSDSLNKGDVRIEVIDGNGLAGNTHVANLIDNNIKFEGENNLKTTIDDIMNDSNSWYEYEIFNIAQNHINNSNGYGFEYKENISWVTNDDNIHMTIKITADDDSIKNWISLKPFIPSIRGVVQPIIEYVSISDKSGNTQYVKTPKFNDGVYIVLFEPQNVSEVIIKLVQKYSYKTLVGHIYSIKTSQSNSNIFEATSDEAINKIDYFKPSIEYLGMKYDPKTRGVIQSRNYTEDNTKGLSEIYCSNNLFTPPHDTPEIKSKKELIPADRYMIGIKNISISSNEYYHEGTYLSRVFKTNNPITSITLEADEFFPSELLKNHKANDLIQYSINLNKSSTWYEIIPISRSFDGYCTIKINEDTIDYKNNESIKCINSIIDINEIQIRIVLNGDKELEFYSPIIYNYKLQVETLDDDDI